MNKRYAATLTICLAFISVQRTGHAQGGKVGPGEEFCIVASVDLTKSQLLLKHPTEVTSLLNINDKTTFTNETGNSIRPSDLRTGDTVWVLASGTGQNTTAIRVRKGPMTLAELHRLYLDYPEIK
jgi:hypothetical protein